MSSLPSSFRFRRANSVFSFGYWTCRGINLLVLFCLRLPFAIFSRLSGRSCALIAIVDTPENLARLIPAIEPMLDTGLIAVSDVQVIRVQKERPVPLPDPPDPG